MSSRVRLIMSVAEKLKKKYQTLWWTVDHFLIVFHLLHGLYINWWIQNRWYSTYFYTSCHSLIGFHLPPAYPTRSQLFFFSLELLIIQRNLHFFFPIRSNILLTFQPKKKKKTREWIWFYHHVRKLFFFFFICMYRELKNKNRGNDTVFFYVEYKKELKQGNNIVSSGWAKNERARAESGVCVCVGGGGIKLNKSKTTTTRVIFAT